MQQLVSFLVVVRIDTGKMSAYYGLYIVLSLVFKIFGSIVKILRLNVAANALKAHFSCLIIGLNDNRPKEATPKDSVNKTELDHLAKMVEWWWDPKGPVKMLHTFYQVRVPLVVEGLAETGRISKVNISKPGALKGIRILEAGCGGGILAEDLAKLGAYVVGVDPGKEMIRLAKNHLETKSSELINLIEYHDVTVEEHVKEFAGAYDAVVCSEVLEHVDEKEAILEACIRCLKPGGSLFITTENRTMLAWLFFIIIPEYILSFLPKGTHFYEKFVSPNTISKLIVRYGCKTRRVRGFFYDRMYNSWGFIDDDSCNYGLHATRC
ncbi:ubiquinone biosynthesis O-methyltransferase-like isoform X1 [Armigeres subalbatus]|uniref:ubiquinone biosynthesis O-methyltransferase-like isoform X1 n=1 Tax=Armigeres subalbatus TaxID=124917 RepID=UPI002ED3C7D9